MDPVAQLWTLDIKPGTKVNAGAAITIDPEKISERLLTVTFIPKRFAVDFTAQQQVSPYAVVLATTKRFGFAVAFAPPGRSNGEGLWWKIGAESYRSPVMIQTVHFICCC